MTVGVELPEAVLRDLQLTPADLDLEVRLMAAARLYERGIASSGRAAEMVNVPRTLLLSRLASFGLSLADPSADELLRDFAQAHGVNSWRP